MGYIMNAYAGTIAHYDKEYNDAESPKDKIVLIGNFLDSFQLFDDTFIREMIKENQDAGFPSNFLRAVSRVLHHS